MITRSDKITFDPAQIREETCPSIEFVLSNWLTCEKKLFGGQSEGHRTVKKGRGVEEKFRSEV